MTVWQGHRRHCADDGHEAVAVWSTGRARDPIRITSSSTTIDLAIRIGFLGLLGYWSFRVIAPLLTMALWSVILAVALYPLFDRLEARLGARVAAAIVTLLSFMIVVGPVTWLGLGMIGAIRGLAAGVDAGQLPIPLPPEAVKSWPIIGGRVHELWSLAANNIKVALAQLLPMLKPLGIKLLDLAQGALFSLLELLISIVIAGFLFARGPQLVDALSAFVSRVLSQRGKELVQLAGATIRNVSRGVVGISMLQAVLAGAGFLAAGIPAPGVLAFVALVLAIVQIGPAFLFLPVVVWSWTAMDTTHALIFTAYMIPVGLLDNILKPVLLARGLTTPMPVIMVGVIGGTVAYGIVGLFFGPIVLSVAWAVMTTWVRGGDAPRERQNCSQQK
jgi:predicted PurR-regulated permease PerM